MISMKSWTVELVELQLNSARFVLACSPIRFPLPPNRFFDMP
jgi:hypothetical protein